MKGKSNKNAALVNTAPTQPDSKTNARMSTPILPEIDSSGGGHKPRPAILVHIRCEKASCIVVDVQIGRWWFGLGFSFWFDISVNRGGDIVPVFPRGQGDE